jgi:SNF2 family DNA or RNA helicase
MFKLLSNTHRSDLNDPTLLQDAFRGTNKIDEIIKTLKTRRQNGNSKIIFCQFRQEMNLIKERLIHSGYSENDVLVYDGRVSKGRRNKIIQDQPEVLVLQVQMGCEGLNLQFANEIYFVGPLWNPAMEDQAIARCYRLGQTKPTHVFKYSMCFSDKSTLSMDNYIEKTLDKKREIQASVYESQ